MNYREPATQTRNGNGIYPTPQPDPEGLRWIARALDIVPYDVSNITRIKKGKAIFENEDVHCQVSFGEHRVFNVKRQSSHGFYTVLKVGNDWYCNCPDCETRVKVCKHIVAAFLYTEEADYQIREFQARAGRDSIRY